MNQNAKKVIFYRTIKTPPTGFGGGACVGGGGGGG